MSGDALAQYQKSAVGRRFIDRPPQGALHLRLVVRGEPPLTLLSLTVEEARENPVSAWTECAHAMAEHASATGQLNFLVAWVGDNDNVLASRPLQGEPPAARPGEGAGDLAQRMDGSQSSQLAQGQRHVYEMSKLYLQAHAAQMAQAIMLLDKYSERTLTAIQQETMLSRENAELRAQLADLEMTLKHIDDEKADEPPPPSAVESIAKMIEPHVGPLVQGAVAKMMTAPKAG